MASGRERLAALRKAGLSRPTTPESSYHPPAQASEQYMGRSSMNNNRNSRQSLTISRASMSHESSYESNVPLPRSPLPPRSPIPPSARSASFPPSIPDTTQVSNEALMASILTDLDALHAEKETSQPSHSRRNSANSIPSRRSSFSLYSPAQGQLDDITTDLATANQSDRDSVASVSTLVAEELDPMAGFYSEIESLQTSVRTLNSHIGRISELHARALDHPASGTEEDNYTNELNGLIETTAALGSLLKRRIKVLEGKTDKGRPSDVQIRKAQTELIKTKFIETLQNYQEIEQQYRAKYKQRMERQFRIVNPKASAEEVRAVVDNTQNGQIFTQALMSTNRHGESRAAFREVQARHEDIQRIEQTLCELAKLFEDMSTLVEQQDETIAAIETKAAAVEKDTEIGLGYATTAVTSARAARKKRWICFAIMGIIALIIIISVAATLKPGAGASAPAKAEEAKPAATEPEKPSRRAFEENIISRNRQLPFGLVSRSNNDNLDAFARLMQEEYPTSRLDSHYSPTWQDDDADEDWELEDNDNWDVEVRDIEL